MWTRQQQLITYIIVPCPHAGWPAGASGMNVQRPRWRTDEERACSRRGRGFVSRGAGRARLAAWWARLHTGCSKPASVAHRGGDIRNTGCTDGCPYCWHRDQAPASVAGDGRMFQSHCWLCWPRQPHHECCRSARDRRHGLPGPQQPRRPRGREGGRPSLSSPIEGARADVSVAASVPFSWGQCRAEPCGGCMDSRLFLLGWSV